MANPHTTGNTARAQAGRGLRQTWPGVGSGLRSGKGMPGTYAVNGSDGCSRGRRQPARSLSGGPREQPRTRWLLQRASSPARWTFSATLSACNDTYDNRINYTFQLSQLAPVTAKTLLKKQHPSDHQVLVSAPRDGCTIPGAPASGISVVTEDTCGSGSCQKWRMICLRRTIYGSSTLGKYGRSAGWMGEGAKTTTLLTWKQAMRSWCLRSTRTHVTRLI